MTDKKRIYELLAGTLSAYVPFYREQTVRVLQDHLEPGDWFVLNAVRAREPEPFSIETALKMSPYTFISAEKQLELYSSLVQRELLFEKDDSGYALTDKGRHIIEGFFNGAHEGLSSIQSLSDEEMAQLVDLLGRLVQAALNAPEPVDKLALQTSRWTEPGSEAPLSAWVDQYVTDLIRFRDDAQLIARSPYGMDRQTWDVLTYVWREEADTAEALAERLSYRGFGTEDYIQTLAELAEDSLIEEKGDRYQMSDEGKRLREETELETDRIMFASWSVLSDEELALLESLLTKANNRLRAAGMELFWPLATGVSQAIFPVTRSAVQPAFQQYFDNPSTFFPILLVTGNAPLPFSIEDYSRRAPYTSPDRGSELLATASSAGMLAESNGGFIVTEEGANARDTVNDVFYSYLAEIDPISSKESEELASLLDRLVDASINADEPDDKWRIINSRNCHPHKEYAPLARIDQLLDDLNAVRDDAHIAAWRANDVDGRSWETLTYVWRGDANTAADLAEKLPFRGYSEADYDQSLTALVERGWIEETAAGYQVTEEGSHIRDEAESATNRLFYEPWSCLNTREQNQLRNLLVRMKLGLEMLAQTELQAEGISVPI